MKNSFLVTGATGFIGANLTRELVRQGHNVSVIVRDKKLNWRLLDISHKINIHECDIQDPKLQEVVNKIKPDYIFHLAAYGALPSEDDINKMTDVNIKGTVNLINAVKQNTFKLFINTGSCVEYGIKDSAMKEDDVLEPINNYGVIKSAVTLYCQKEAIRNNLPLVNLRLFTPFGYFENKNRLIPSIILSAIKDEPIKVSAPGSVRDFIFIEDVVDAYLHAIKMPFSKGEIFNIGIGKQHTIKEIINICLKLSNSKSQILWGTVEKQSRFIEPKTWKADMSKTKTLLKWEPKNSIESGLQKTIDWFRKNKNLYSEIKRISS